MYVVRIASFLFLLKFDFLESYFVSKNFFPWNYSNVFIGCLHNFAAIFG